MKKIIFLAAVLAVVALIGINTVMPQSSNEPKRFSSQEELNTFVKENSQSGYGGLAVTSDMAMGAAVKSAQSGSVSESAPSSVQRSSDYSQTNIQVQGVDEADIVKTDGKHIYAVSGSKVLILDAYPADNAKIVSQIETNGSVNEIFINKDRLVVFGQRNYEYPIQEISPESGISVGPVGSKPLPAEEMSSQSIARPSYYSPRTFIEVYDISDRNSPSLARNVSVDGGYYDSRMIGDYVYVIANQPVYNYGGPVPLPVISSDGTAKEMPATDVYYFDNYDTSFIFTNILSLNTQTGEEPSSKTFLMGYAQNMYVSSGNIYITYQKRVSEFRYYDRIIDEIILPLVPSDIQNRISEIRNSNSSKYEKMQEIGKAFEDYLRTLNPEQAAGIMRNVEEKAAILQREIAKEIEKTVIHKISVDNGRIEYKTNGEVPGRVLNQFSMDEHNGYFRIATTTSGNSWGGGISTRSVMTGSVQTSVSEQLAVADTAQSKAEMQISNDDMSIPKETLEKIKQIDKEKQDSESNGEIIAKGQEEQIEPIRPVQTQVTETNGPQNHMYVLDGNLKTVGKLEDLAGGETIHSARFLGDKAYMVTFRQTDPLFVIDLSNPADPKVLGYLKIPGVSDYLHPYDETHIIGVGRDATDEGRIRGMKLALFDVSDVANPKEISKYIIGDQGTYSEALNDHKAFLFSKEKNLLVIPVSEYDRTPMEGVPEWQWKTNYWQGAYVFNLDLASGFALKGKITHQNNTENSTYYYDWNSQIRRSLFIENTLYTLSNRMIRMNNLADLAEINKIELPYQQNNWVYY